MRSVIRKLAACAAMLCMLTACAVNPGGAGQEGATEMTEMALNALRLAGYDMEQFDPGNPRLSEQVLIDAAECLERTLSEKYPGVAFTLTACLRHGIDQPYDEFHFTTGQTGVVVARVYTNDDGSFRCTDGFYGAAKAAEFDEKILSLIADIEPEAASYSTLNGQFGDDVTLDTPLDDVLAGGELLTYTWILLPPGDRAFAGRVSAIRERLAAGKQGGDFSVYLLTEQGTAAAMTREEALERIPADRQAHRVFSEFTRFIED